MRQSTQSSPRIANINSTLVAQHLYDFVWSDYCDWFVEAAKTDIFSEDEAKKKSALAVMDFVLSATLRLLHPFMPHLTEEIWSLLGLGKDSIQFAAPPEKLALDAVPTLQRAATRISASMKLFKPVAIYDQHRNCRQTERYDLFYARMINRFLSEIPTLTPIVKCGGANARSRTTGAGWHSSGSHSVGRTFSR